MTDAAVVEAVVARCRRRFLDIGCGEGWLTHALLDRGLEGCGCDATPALLERARRPARPDFYPARYDGLSLLADHGPFDCLVCNFSLLAENDPGHVVEALPALAPQGGYLLVQTLHPLVVEPELPYRDGWRTGSWDGFGPEFRDPAPWYFRTLSSWLETLTRTGARLVELDEPPHPETGRPASLLLTVHWPGR